MIADLVVAALIIVSAGIAFLRGFIREVLTIVGVVGGLIAAWTMGPTLVPYFSNWFGVPTDAKAEMPKLMGLVPMDIVAMASAYAVVFIVVTIVLSLFSHVLAGAARKLGLGPVDRTLGVVFGIARAVFLLAFLYLPFYLISGQAGHDELFKDSRAYVYVKGLSAWMAGYVPADAASSIVDGAGRARDDASTTGERINALQALKEKAREASAIVEDGAQELMAPNDGGYAPDDRDGLNHLIQDAQ